jgi:hypothetical protein
MFPFNSNIGRETDSPFHSLGPYCQLDHNPTDDNARALDGDVFARLEDTSEGTDTALYAQHTFLDTTTVSDWTDRTEITEYVIFKPSEIWSYHR